MLPTLVIDPCVRFSPEERSLGTSPTKPMNRSAPLKRWKSPISTARLKALRVSIPRRQRSRATSEDHGPSIATSRISASKASMRASTRSMAWQ